jgi:hypothetical protein
VRNMLIKKEQSKWITCESVDVKSMISYLLVRCCDQKMLRNVKVILQGSVFLSITFGG